MARPTWTLNDATPEQLELWKKAIEAVARAKTADQEQWRTLAAAKEAGIPLRTLVEAAGLPRATVYRHLGKPTT